jgi:hypothetical protein
VQASSRALTDGIQRPAILFPELGNSEAGVEQGPDHQLFLVRGAGVGQACCFVGG